MYMCINWFDRKFGICVCARVWGGGGRGLDKNNLSLSFSLSLSLSLSLSFYPSEGVLSYKKKKNS